jgi:hypothetical protein
MSMQHDCPAACVMAQQYSSATFFSSRFHSRKDKFGAPFKKLLFQFFRRIRKIAKSGC